MQLSKSHDIGLVKMANYRRRELRKLTFLTLLEFDDEVEDAVVRLLLSNALTSPAIKFCVSIDGFSSEEYLTNFRFSKEDINQLHEYLHIPPVYSTYNRTSASGMEALLILLWRMVYPNRWADLVPMFGRSEPELSIIFSEILTDIYNRFHHLLDNLNLAWLDLESFMNAIYNRGAALSNCWGFIDGTARACARPIHNQCLMYSGHKRVHCLKFQSVETPNGLIAHCYGPIEGRRHDAFVLGQSGLLPQIQHFTSRTGEPLCLYGDPAYPLRANLEAPYRGANLTQEQLDFNKSMSQVRVSVEWGFGKVVNLFAFLDFRKNLKVLLQPVAKIYLVGAY